MSKFKDFVSGGENAESLRMRDTAKRDRQLAPPPAWQRHRRLIIVCTAVAVTLGLLATWPWRFSGISTFRRPRATHSPTLCASDPGIVTLRVHAGDAVSKGAVLAVVDSHDSPRSCHRHRQPWRACRSIGSAPSSMRQQARRYWIAARA